MVTMLHAKRSIVNQFYAASFMLSLILVTFLDPVRTQDDDGACRVIVLLPFTSRCVELHSDVTISKLGQLLYLTA